MHSDNDQPSSSDPPDRKSSKPLMEKRRRARINSSLAELKTLLMDVIRREGACHSKMEKADILEMTVRHLRQITGSSCTDPTTGSKHKLGFVECTQEVSRFLSRVEGCDVELRTKLLDHLANVASGSERHERASSMSSLPFQPTNPNQPVLLTNFPMQEQPRQVPFVSESVPHKIDLNPSLPTSGIQSNIMSGLHVIPTQLRSGEIAFVLPTQIAEIPKSSSVVIPLMNTVNPTLALSTEGTSSGQTKDVPKLYRNIRVKSETVSSPPKSPLPKSSPESVSSAPFTNVRIEPAISSSSCFSTPSDSFSRISNISCISQPLPSDDIKSNVSFKSQGNILSVEHTKHYSQPKFQDEVKEKDINIIPTFSDISQMHRKEKYGSDLQTGLKDDTPTSSDAEGSIATNRYINFEKGPISSQQPKTIFTPQFVIPQSDGGLDLRLSGRTVETIPIISKYDGKESNPFSLVLQHEQSIKNSDNGTVGNLSAGCSSLNADVISRTQHDNSKRDENDNNFNPDSQSDRDENDNNINENANENQETGMWRPW